MSSPSGAEVLQIIQGHSSDVTGCDFFGYFLASCSSDKSVRLWILDNEKKFSEAKYSPLMGHTYGVNCVRFSPFGTLLASCSTDGTVILWSVEGGDKISELKHSSGSPIRVCAFIPSSTILATGGDDEKIVLWDIATKSIIRILDGHEAMITSLAFAPDSAFLISCSSAGDIMLWDARYGHGKCLASYADAHDLGVLGCDFSPQCEPKDSGTLSNYSFATAGNDDLVKLWCIQTGTKISISHSATLIGHSGSVFSCRFSVDGMFLASTGADHSVILWDSATLCAVKKLEGHSRFVTCSAFSNSWLLASGSSDKTIAIWALDTSKIADSVSCLSIATSNHHNIADADKKNISSWTVDDVAEWLKSLELSELSELFQKHAIDGRELLHLTHENLLTAMKIDALGKRNKILRSIQAVKNPLWKHVTPDFNDSTILEEFFCPITHDIMIDPVVASDGYSYENSAISEWFENGNNTSPMTNETLEHTILIPNRILQSLIQKYKM